MCRHPLSYTFFFLILIMHLHKHAHMQAHTHTHTKSYHLAIIWFSYQEKFSQDVVNLHSFFQELYFVCCIMCLPLSLLIFCVFIRPVFNNFVLEKIIKKRPSVYLQCPSVFQKHNLPNEKSSTCMRVAQIVYNKP